MRKINLMPSIFHRYSRLVQKYPFRVNAATLGLLFGIGDFVSQRVFPPSAPGDDHPAYKMLMLAGWHDNEYNYPRTLRAITYGTFVFSGIVTFWQTKVLPKIHLPIAATLRAKINPSHMHVYDTLARLTVDQLTMPGLVFIPLYNFSMVCLAGYDHPFEVTKEKLEKNWWNVLKASWVVWGGFQFSLLMWIPVHLRVVAGNLWQVGWLSFLSFCHNSKNKSHLIEELVEIQDEQLV